MMVPNVAYWRRTLKMSKVFTLLAIPGTFFLGFGPCGLASDGPSLAFGACLLAIVVSAALSALVSMITVVHDRIRD